MRSSERCRAAAVILAALLACPAHAESAGPLPQARAAAQAGDHAGALASLDAWLTEHPGDRDARFLRAQVLAWSGDYAASRAAYDELLAEIPDDVDARFGRAQVALWNGEPDRALEDIEAARAIAPDYAALAELERQAHEAMTAGIAPSPAEAPGRPRELIVQASWEDLDRGYDDWVNVAVSARAGVTPDAELRGSAAYVRRYGEGDVEASLGGSWSAAQRLEIGADLGAAADAGYLPEWSALAYALTRLTATTTLQLAYRHASYSNTRNDTVSLTVEQYFDRFRFAYSLHRGDPADAKRTWSHVGRFDYYYGESSSAGLLYTTGEESESDGAGGLFVTPVEGVALLGRHALTQDWTLLWAATWHDQGDLYRRAGFNVGVARRF
ncbi:MAG: YaiO family outer membrane beta-barrel protein [Steroidobacteraceae bacterium]|jgi:YaiO family outer membrane protein|nr:YaiO family outer membrane beta-barrel protein [Steroidobacteraceae bacterium]